MSLLDDDWGTDKPARPATPAEPERADTKNHDTGRDTTRARTAITHANGNEAVRQQIARDLTHDNMSRWERLTTWWQGRSNEYTEDAYRRAFPSRQDLTPEQQAYWAAYDKAPLSWTEWKTQQAEQGRAR